MKHRKLFALGTQDALFAIVFTTPAPRVALMDGLIGFAEATQRVCEDHCSTFNHPHIPLWQRFDPSCPQWV